MTTDHGGAPARRRPLAAALGAAAWLACGAGQAAAQPNIILMLTDDQTPSLAEAMPSVQALAARGATFTHAYYNDPLCEPSRAAILTGQYAQNTGVLTNDWSDFAASGASTRSVALALHAAGYRTALIGKYVNGYPGKAGIQPGWDRWMATIGAAYFGGKVEDQGKVRPLAPTDYQTDVLGAAAVDFVRQATADGVPFFLYLALHAPHVAAQPPARYAGSDPGVQVPRTPSFSEADVSDKPAYVRAKRPLSASEILNLDSVYANMARSLLAADEWLSTLESALADAGQLENTYVVVASDNGWMSGQHRIRGAKGLPYEESLRMPLYAAGPGVAPGSTVAALVGNADLAPTFAEWGGTVMPAPIDGRSFASLLAAPPPAWRQAYPITYRQGTAGTQPGWRGLRTDNYAYVEYATGERELYDMTADPYQLTNIAATADPTLLAQLAQRTADLAACSADGCRALEDQPLTGAAARARAKRR